ncbi:MAG: type II toxin-antitoxin system Phd/YefM family antitoxin [Nitrospinota bacterium]
MSKLLKTKPQIIMKNGRPDAVIIDLNDYERLLERLEEKEDIEGLQEMRAGGTKFRKFDDFLAEHK